jgi:hypothetical protein
MAGPEEVFSREYRRTNMRRSPLTLYFVGGLLILLLASCSPIVHPTGKQDVTNGSFSYVLSPFNPVIAKAYAKAHQDELRGSFSSSRAFMAAAKVKFEVHQWDSTGGAAGTAGTMGSDVIVETWTDYPSLTSQDTVTTAVIGTHSLAAGSYSLYAKVYADINAADSDYMVYGSKYFTITDGQKAADNQQTIVCYPQNVTWFYQGSSASGATLTKPWVIESSGKLTTMGSEAWYAFYPQSADPSKVTVTPDSGSKAILYVFVFDGTTGALAKINGADAFQVSATAGSTVVLSGITTQKYYSYYVCVIDVGSVSDTNRSYSIKYDAVVAPPANPTLFTPEQSITPGTRSGPWTAGTIDDYAVPKWFYIDTIPGKTYYFWMNSYNYGYETYGYYYYGNGTATADIIGAAYQKDYSTPYFTYLYPYSGYNYGSSFTATEDKVYFKIESNYSTGGASGTGTGSFGINVTTDKETTLSFGNKESSGGSVWIEGNQFQGSKFTVTKAGTLLKFGFIPQSSSVSYYDYNDWDQSTNYYKYVTDNLKVTFALYKANGTVNGYDNNWSYTTYSDGPGDLVGYTDATPVTSADGVTAVEIPLALASGTALAAGDYWIMANTNAYTNLSGTTTYGSLQSFYWTTFGSAPPTALSGSAYIYPQYQTFDFYIQMKE